MTKCNLNKSTPFISHTSRKRNQLWVWKLSKDLREPCRSIPWALSPPGGVSQTYMVSCSAERLNRPALRLSSSPVPAGVSRRRGTGGIIDVRVTFLEIHPVKIIKASPHPNKNSLELANNADPNSQLHFAERNWRPRKTDLLGVSGCCGLIITRATGFFGDDSQGFKLPGKIEESGPHSVGSHEGVIKWGGKRATELS